MLDLTGVTHHPCIEEIVDVLVKKTQNTDRGFFRAEVAFFLGKMASNMRAIIDTKDRGEVPINCYVIALAGSGYGKGHSVSIMENEFIKGYKTRFMNETLHTIADQSLWELADKRSIRNSTTQDEEKDKLDGEYGRAGAFPFTFDSGTAPAVKQLRQKLLLGRVGAINLQIDEIGSNLINNTEVLNVFLELYDQGVVKQKLTKNTNDSIRGEEVDGKTPANMLLFGTPAKLLDGGLTEEQFYSFLETGYARRCIFGIGSQDRKAYHTLSAKEIYDKLVAPSNGVTLSRWANRFENLADPAMYGYRISVGEAESIYLLEYKLACERAADVLPDHEEIKKAELGHRYFKVLKLAGAYAFVDMSTIITKEHLQQAMLLVEESGAAFQKILNREKTYVKLAKYIASCNNEVTHADLHEALPFYKSSNSARNEMMTMATAWGYKKHIIIKKSFVDGIEFFSGETLKETDLNKIMISYSDNFAYNYEHEEAPFDRLHELMTMPDMHWCNHGFKNKHRAEENVIPGFNMIVIDVDGGVTLDTVHDLMKDYKFMTYTTKRYTDDEHRFRLLLPINYRLDLDVEDYREFMNSFMSWLPFKTDEGANQRSKKWMTHEGKHFYNTNGSILDALPFVPKTSKNETYKNAFAKVESMDNLERWFAQRMAEGNRNNQFIKYAYALMDTGMDLITVSERIHALNEKISNPLPEEEINNTVLKSAAKRYVGGRQ